MLYQLFVRELDSEEFIPCTPAPRALKDALEMYEYYRVTWPERLYRVNAVPA